VKDYRVIFVFDNDKALATFLDSGWSASGQADAAAKAGDKGGAYSGAVEVAPGVWVKAVQLDDSLAEAHAALGYAATFNWDWQRSEKELRRALELNPNLALAYITLLLGAVVYFVFITQH